MRALKLGRQAHTTLMLHSIVDQMVVRESLSVIMLNVMLEREEEEILT